MKTDFGFRNAKRHSILHSILLVENWGFWGPGGSTAISVQAVCYEGDTARVQESPNGGKGPKSISSQVP